MTSGTGAGPSGFDYDYFDNPNGRGYRGYRLSAHGDQFVRSWDDMAIFCKGLGVGSAIDIGCAKGFLVGALRRHGVAAIGYDVSEYALSFANGLPCFQHDIATGIPDTADAVFCLGVLLYLEPARVPEVLRWIHSACRRYLMFSSFYVGDEQSVPDPLRRVTQTRDWWRHRIEESGFQFVSTQEYFDVYASR